MLRQSQWVWLVAGLIAVTLLPALAGEGCGADARKAAPSGPDVSFDLRPGGAAAKRPAVVVLGGARLMTVAALGKPGTEYAVQLGYDGTVVRQAPLRLNEEGFGDCSLAAPDVRVRAECELAVVGTRGTIRQRPVVVLPSVTLAARARLIEDERLGVIDGRGRLQAAFKAERAPVEDLSTRLLQDGFDGGLIFVAGITNSDVLTDTCRRLEGRIEEGMTVVLVNPPAGWQRWNASVRKLAAVVEAPVMFSKDFGKLIHGTDLGTGPWALALEICGWPAGGDPGQAGSAGAAGEWKPLAWIEGAAKAGPDKSRRPVHALVAARRVGKGLAVVVLMQTMESPATDARGRGVLDEIVVWLLKRPAEAGKSE